MTPLQVCEAIIEKRLADRKARAFFSGLPDDERHYWIASLYALLSPRAALRRASTLASLRAINFFRSDMSLLPWRAPKGRPHQSCG
jgi:hypothetical protein